VGRRVGAGIWVEWIGEEPERVLRDQKREERAAEGSSTASLSAAAMARHRRWLWLAGARAEVCLRFYRRHGEGGVDDAGKEAGQLGQRPRRSAGRGCRRAAVVTRRARRSRAQRRCKRGGSRRGHSDGAGRGQEARQQRQAAVMPCSALRSGSREAEQRREKGGRERESRERKRFDLKFSQKISHELENLQKQKLFKI